MKDPITDIAQLDLNKTYSYADYLSWHIMERVELIRGRIRKMSAAPSTLHINRESRIAICNSRINNVRYSYQSRKPIDFLFNNPNNTSYEQKRIGRKQSVDQYFIINNRGGR